MLRTILGVRRLRHNWRRPISEMEKLRSKKLRAILRYAYNNVPFYHRKFDEAHVKPDDIKSALDLWKIPPTTKNEIQRTPPLDLVSNDFDLRRCRKDSTSGSSGMPLTTYMSKEAFDFYSMVWTAMFLENGVRPWDKEAIIGDPRTFPERRSLPEFFGIMPKKYISIFADEQKQLEHLKVYRPDIIDGFPSSLSIIANEHNRRKEGLMPRLIFTHAETLDRHTRRFLIKSFEADLLDYYGSSELSLIAWECSEHMGYHINSDCMVVEFLRNGDSIGAAESGEITCTSLVNYVMPLIRYRQGDIAVPLGEPCRCGKTLPMLKAIEGRADDFLVTLDGRVISPSIFFPYPFKSYGNIKQFKVIQERKDLLKIQLLTDGALGEKILEEAKEDIWKVFGKGMQVEFELLDEFKRASSGKIKKIESRIQIKFE